MSGATGAETGGQPQRGCGVGRTATHAARHRDSLVDHDPHRRPGPPAGAQSVQRLRHDVESLHAGAHDLVGRAHRRRRDPDGRRRGPGGQDGRHLDRVGQRHRLEQRHELVSPIGAHRPEEQAQVDLPRRPREQRHEPPSLAASSRNSSGDSRSARSSGGWPSATRASRARSRTPRGAPGASASDPASALRRWANASCTSARTPGSTPAEPESRRCSPTSTESTRGTGRNTVRDTGRSTRTSQASWASTDGTP